MSLHTVVIMDLFLDSINDSDVICCFLYFHEMRELPRNMQKPIVDRHVSGKSIGNCVSCEFQLKGSREKNTLSKSRLDITRDFNYGNVMRYLRSCHELT